MSTFTVSADDLLMFYADSSLSFFDWIIKARTGLQNRHSLRACGRRRAHLPNHDFARMQLRSKAKRGAAMWND
jgi:ribosomal protein S14